ncbi:AlpA family phage regulatory protein, partial [Pseudomonas aeruginosa]
MAMADKTTRPQRFIRIKEVLSITSLSKSDLYRRIAAG